MSNEIKTAVEQFIEQLEEQGHSWETASIKTIEISIKVEDYLKLKQAAKEMEKEKMNLVWNDSRTNLVRSSNGFDFYTSFEDYYNETFKTK